MKKIVIMFALILFGLAVLAQQKDNKPYVNLMSKKNGAKIVSFSSHYGDSWDVYSLIAGQEFGEMYEMPVWCSETDAPFPHWAIIELKELSWITTIIFNNYLVDEDGYPGISAKDLQVQVSSKGPNEGFKTVASFALERNKNNQEVSVAPIQARWVKIIVTSNYGNSTWTELGQLGAYDNGTRPSKISELLKKEGYAHIYGIYFDFASATIRRESDVVLEEIASALKENPSWHLTIEGHTDNVGGDESNQVLSKKRAIAVRDELTKQGIDTGRLTCVGYGKSKPIADNITNVGRAQNRRVTIRIEM